MSESITQDMAYRHILRFCPQPRPVAIPNTFCERVLRPFCALHKAKWYEKTALLFSLTV